MIEIISWFVLVLVFSLIHIKMSRKRKQRENGKLTIGEKQKYESALKTFELMNNIPAKILRSAWNKSAFKSFTIGDGYVDPG